MTSGACSFDPAGRPFLIVSGPEDPLSATLARGGEVLAHEAFGAFGRTMTTLSPAIEGMLAAEDLAPSDLGGVAMVRGPGSFTGLRVSMAVAVGLAIGAGLPMAGIDYLPLLARNAEGTVFVLTYSRKKQAYLQGFTVEPGRTPVPLAPPQALYLDAAVDQLASAVEGGPISILGSGLRRNLEAFAVLPPAAALLPENCDAPRPEHLLRAAQEAGWCPSPPDPFYLRASDAEENLPGIAKARGLAPEEAEKTFRTLTGR